MRERYEPPSEFLQAVIAKQVPLGTGEFAEANLRQLIGLMSDDETSNRDWATLLLSQSGANTPDVRAALKQAALDEDAVVRAEAILGLAQRDPSVALPFVQIALRADTISVPMLEAAAICAHPSLIADLQVWAEPSDEPYIDQLAVEALAACERPGG